MDARVCPNCNSQYIHVDLDLSGKHGVFSWKEIIEYSHCHSCGCFYKNTYAVNPELTEQEIIDI